MVKEKSDIHQYFKKILANGTTRKTDAAECVFCSYTIALHAGKMRQHLSTNCSKVPTSIKSKYDNVRDSIHTKPAAAFSSSQFMTSKRKRNDDSEEDSPATLQPLSKRSRSAASGPLSISTETNDSEANPTSVAQTELTPSTINKTRMVQTSLFGNVASKSPVMRKRNQPTTPLTPVSMSGFDTISKEENDELCRTWARAVYSANWSFHSFSNSHVIAAFKKTRPAFQPPSRKALVGHLLDKEYSSLHSMVQSTFNDAKGITYLTDGWSNRRREPILNHVLTTPIPIYVTSTETHDNRHTAQYLLETMSEVLGSCHLLSLDDESATAVNCVDGVCTDSPNVNVSFRRMCMEKYPRLLGAWGCAPHLLHCFARDILNLSELRVVCQHSQRLVKFFRDHHVPMAVLKEKQELTTGKVKQPIVGCETRWGSNVRTIEFVNDNFQPIELTLIDDRCADIKGTDELKLLMTRVFKDRLKSSLSLMKPIILGIHALEGESASMAGVLPFLNKLKEHLVEQLPGSAFTKKSDEKKVIEMLSHRIEQIVCPLHYLATALHPDHSDAIQDQESFEIVRDTLLDVARKLGIGPTIMKEFFDFRNKQNSFPPKYFTTEYKDCFTAGYDWWHAYFPYVSLTKVASKVLTLCPTVASCDRFFSKSGRTQSKDRSRLGNDTLDKLVFVQTSLHLLDRLTNQGMSWKELNPVIYTFGLSEDLDQVDMDGIIELLHDDFA